MRLRGIKALICAAVLLLPAVSATAAQAAEKDESLDNMQVMKWGLGSVEKAVLENNPTAKSLLMTAAGMTGGSVDYTAQTEGLEAQAASYQSLIDGMDAAMRELDTDIDLYKTYAAQKKLLQNSLDSLQASISAPQYSTASLQAEDMAYQLQRQSKDIANQLAAGAQNMLISVRTLQLSEEQLNRQLDAAERNISTLELKLSCGMVSQYDVDTAKHQRDNLCISIDRLQSQCRDMASNIALMCGFGADTLIMPSTLAKVYHGDLNKMDYKTDLQQVLKNSYTIWQKWVEFRSTSNKYDENDAGAEEALQAARDSVTAEQKEVENAFQTIFQSVLDKKEARDAAETALEQAELDFKTQTIKYNSGMLSMMDYLDAQDKKADAEQALSTAELELLSAYKQYQWALEGYVSKS